ncbi:hypothetical protein VYU27_002722 [Nannochloropsis oceanica]
MKATLELTFGFHNHFLYSDRTGALKRGERRAGPAARPKKGDRAVFLCERMGQRQRRIGNGGHCSFSCTSRFWKYLLLLLVATFHMASTRGLVRGTRTGAASIASSFIPSPNKPTSSIVPWRRKRRGGQPHVHATALEATSQGGEKAAGGGGADGVKAWNGIARLSLVVPPPIPSALSSTSSSPSPQDDVLLHPPTLGRVGGAGRGGEKGGKGGRVQQRQITNTNGCGYSGDAVEMLQPVPQQPQPEQPQRQQSPSQQQQQQQRRRWLSTQSATEIEMPRAWPSSLPLTPQQPMRNVNPPPPSPRPPPTQRHLENYKTGLNQTSSTNFQRAAPAGPLKYARQQPRVQAPPFSPSTNTTANHSSVSIEGVVKRITFASGSTGFSVLKIDCENLSEVITVVGNFGPVSVGMGLSVRGDWKHDARWGKQLCAVQYKETAPATQEGIENYLASGLVKGIGPVAARQIVSHFGVRTLEVLNETPERLVEVEGIGPKRVQLFIKAWQGQKEVTEVMLFLQSHNVSTTLATKIYKKYGNSSVEVLRRNPYQLADEMEGVGFRTVDKIAAQLPNFDPGSARRHRSGLLFILNEHANEGHCYGTRQGLLREGSRLLGAAPDILDSVVDEMIENRDLIVHYHDGASSSSSADRARQKLQQMQEGAQQYEALYLPFYDMCEAETARRIQELMCSTATASAVASLAGNKDKAARAIERVQQWSGVTFDKAQLQGLMTAARGRFTVLTGGPGTGKTTMALAIIRLFGEEGAGVALAAPTGRAAQRLADGTGLEAKTIHRLLEYSSETKAFGRGPGNLLDCDVLVVDEASMVDVVLMHHLLAALPPSASVVLVGDVDQLPPVGPGNVLRDIIDSKQVEVVRLSNIFRQAAQSAIIVNAHRINRGEMPEFGSGGTGEKRGRKKKQEAGVAAPAAIPVVKTPAAAATGADKVNNDFFLIEEEDPTKLVGLITELCVKRLSKHYKLDPIKDIQVLCPMKKGEVGTLHLNTVLQQALNPRGANECVKYGGREYRLGDKVMQVKNNYEKNVFNGGVGRVVEVRPAEKKLTVAFDGTEAPVSYDATDLDQIMLAYAATVHKAQGSEYRVVVAPLLSRQHHVMLQRNLLYTCVTRAKEVLVLVGSKAAVAKAVGNDKPSGRNSLLHRRLLDLAAKEER